MTTALTRQWRRVERSLGHMVQLTNLKLRISRTNERGADYSAHPSHTRDLCVGLGRAGPRRHAPLVGFLFAVNYLTELELDWASPTVVGGVGWGGHGIRL